MGWHERALEKHGDEQPARSSRGASPLPFSLPATHCHDRPYLRSFFWCLTRRNLARLGMLGKSQGVGRLDSK
jgi:hypothetical protein